MAEIRSSKRKTKNEENIVDHEAINLQVATTSATSTALSSKEKKIGHRRVDRAGNITYKKFRAGDLIKCIQTGIRHSVSKWAPKPERDLLMKDFTMVERVFHKKEGTATTPAHAFIDFTFKSYAPIAFRYFRDLFGIAPDDYMISLCDRAMIEISNPGASGSIFYLTEDDEFILKTVMFKEAEFLQKLLAGYYMNLNQNPRTLLPKFFGLYVYQSLGKNVRVICMNNLLPRKVKYHQKFDLKGSTYKRQASTKERQKQVPTLKDLDFMQLYPEGIFLEPDTYDILIRTIRRDCTVLESFKIMDYSLLVGIHNLDQAAREEEAKNNANENTNNAHFDNEQPPPNGTLSVGFEKDVEKERRSRSPKPNKPALVRTKTNRDRFAAIPQDASAPGRSRFYSKLRRDDLDGSQILPDGLLAWNSKGERLLLFVGIIDILQCYQLRKKVEHTMKSVVLDGESISVCHPSFYSRRFQNFMADKVFRKMAPGVLPNLNSSSVSLSNREDKGTNPLSADSSPEAPPVVRQEEGKRRSQRALKSRISTGSIGNKGDGNTSTSGAGDGRENGAVSYTKLSKIAAKPDLIRDTDGAADETFSSPVQVIS